MPRAEKRFGDLIITREGILEVTFVSGGKRYLALFSPTLVRRARAAFYARFAETSPVGEPNVKLVPWSDVASSRLYLVPSGSKGMPTNWVPVFEFTTLEESEMARLTFGQIHGFIHMLRDALGDRFENSTGVDISPDAS